MEELPSVGPKIRELRTERGWTLDALSSESAVSRSMLSEIERGDANPTFATLWKITEALGVGISELVSGDSNDSTPQIEVTSPEMTPRMSSPDGKVSIQALSPIRTADSIEWYELVFEGDGVLASSAHAANTIEHLTVLEGAIEVTAGESHERVGPGATARYRSDQSHTLTNPHTKRSARALLVMLRDQS